MKELNIPYYFHNKSYPEPEEISLQLTLGDIWLDFSLNGECAREMEHLRSGETLCWREQGAGEKCRLFFDSVRDGKTYPVAAASKEFSIKKYGERRRRGYEIVKVQVLYVVWWHNKENTKEGYIALPLIRMRKKK